MNIHPAETWNETIEAINKYACVIKQQICPDNPFALGLRLSNLASVELAPLALQFKEYLVRRDMYVATINGFPYGQFHNGIIKENVYLPDWSQPERVTYTKRLARLLAILLPEGMVGSISTVPVCYGKKLPEGSLENIFETTEELSRIKAETGKTIVLCLEPEPDCYLETTMDALRLWNVIRKLGKGSFLEFLGICLDTCHIACAFENPTNALIKMKEADIQVPKIQISSILRVSPRREYHTLFKPFLNSPYLHQTRVLSQGTLLRFPDLEAALKENPMGEWRIHFHTPLYFEDWNGLETTSFDLNKSFFEECCWAEKVLEIETYTFKSMPFKNIDVTESICAEFNWILNGRSNFNVKQGES
ncbi:MAG: xylose isomerase [Candidatus Brocadia sp.]|nr:xylose isomerase [Candidatus Brocadia sp.]